MPLLTEIKPVKSLFRVVLDDGSSLFLLPDIMYSRSLKEGNSYEESVIASIIEENSEMLCFQALLKILRTRMHSSGELKRKLAAKKFSYSVIDKTITKAIESGVTNNDRAAEFYRNELISKGYGSYKIRDSMKKKGFDQAEIEKFTSESSEENLEEESENARRIFDKKLAFLQKDKCLTYHKIKEKLFRFMQSKGYPTETILTLMKDFSE